MKRNILISKTFYLYLFGTLLGAYFFGLLLYAIWGVSWVAPIYFFLIISILFGPSLLEKNITKYNGVMEFTFPVSTFERFLSLVLRYAVLYPIICFGTYYILNLIFGNLPFSSLNGFAENMSVTNLLDYKAIHTLIGGQSIFLLGYPYFNKNSFIKTCFACFVILVALSMFAGLVMTQQLIKAFSGDIVSNMIGIGEQSNLSFFCYCYKIFLSVPVSGRSMDCRIF
ncbi:MAG: hypothetical protein LIP01_13050 [Tannerellaceae bacterium]|nr:hypothetical protein [Tannerellaceae bacterium]